MRLATLRISRTGSAMVMTMDITDMAVTYVLRYRGRCSSILIGIVRLYPARSRCPGASTSAAATTLDTRDDHDDFPFCAKECVREASEHSHCRPHDLDCLCRSDEVNSCHNDISTGALLLIERHSSSMRRGTASTEDATGRKLAALRTGRTESAMNTMADITDTMVTYVPSLEGLPLPQANSVDLDHVSLA